MPGMKALHAWDLTPAEAMKTQEQLRSRLALAWDGREVKAIGGVDMSLTDEKAHAAIVVLHYPDLTPIEGVTADVPLVFPYVPGLLAFREGPAILAALLLAELIYILARPADAIPGAALDSKEVGIVMFGPYLLGVELASMLLLAGLVGACHLGWRQPEEE